MFWVDFICVFIVAYMLWMIARWLVLPHLRIFPYIKPQWLWVTLYHAFSYVMNMLFFWILLFLLIVYVTWLIIRKLPNFPIPIKRILLRMSPWRPLEKAGVLGLIDDIRKIFFSFDSFDKRIQRAAGALGRFFEKSFFFLGEYANAAINKNKTPNSLEFEAPASSGGGNDLNVKATRKTVNQTSQYEQEEVDHIQDDYLQCLEEGSEPVYNNQGMETAKAIARNQTNAIMCKVQSFTTYSNLLNNRIS